MFETLFSNYNQVITALTNGVAGLAGSYLAFKAALAGFAFARSDDPHKKQDAQNRLKNIGIAAGIIGSATYIANQVLSIF